MKNKLRIFSKEKRSIIITNDVRLIILLMHEKNNMKIECCKNNWIKTDKKYIFLLVYINSGALARKATKKKNACKKWLFANYVQRA